MGVAVHVGTVGRAAGKRRRNRSTCRERRDGRTTSSRPGPRPPRAAPTRPEARPRVRRTSRHGTAAGASDVAPPRSTVGRRRPSRRVATPPWSALAALVSTRSGPRRPRRPCPVPARSDRRRSGTARAPASLTPRVPPGRRESTGVEHERVDPRPSLRGSGRRRGRRSSAPVASSAPRRLRPRLASALRALPRRAGRTRIRSAEDAPSLDRRCAPPASAAAVPRAVRVRAPPDRARSARGPRCAPELASHAPPPPDEAARRSCTSAPRPHATSAPRISEPVAPTRLDGARVVRTRTEGRVATRRRGAGRCGRRAPHRARAPRGEARHAWATHVAAHGTAARRASGTGSPPTAHRP